MDHSSIGLIVLLSPILLTPLGLASERLYWTEWVQERVLRLTGESRLVATAWGHAISPRRPLVPRRARGVTPAGGAPGNRRTPAGASVVHADVKPQNVHVGVDTVTLPDPSAHGQGDPKLTAATQCPDRRVVAVHHWPSAS